MKIRSTSLLALALALSAFVARGAVLTLAIGPDCIPDLAEDCPFSIDFTASGGTPPYTFSLGGGTLPPGLALAASGTLSGIPTAAGLYSFTVNAADGASDSGSRDYAVMVMEHWNVVLGEGISPLNGNQVHIFDANGGTAASFTAYGAGQYGVNVAAGDVANGPGVTTTSDEILTGPGPGAVYGPHVRGWYRDGSSIAKVNFFAYGTLKYGVNVASGDLDGDGWDEIVTGAGAGDVFGPHVRGWNYDNTTLTGISKLNFFAYSTLKYGVNVATGDVDGDCMAEIATAPGPGSVFSSNVRGFNYDGIQVTSISKLSFLPFSYSYGANLALGDVDADHYDEIVATPGPGPNNPNLFLGFDFDGSSIAALPGYDVTAFPTMYGGRAGMSCVADPPGAIVGGMDLLAAPGPDPNAPAEIKVYAYSGTGLIEIVPPPGPFSIPGSGRGVNPVGARLGW